MDDFRSFRTVCIIWCMRSTIIEDNTTYRTFSGRPICIVYTDDRARHTCDYFVLVKIAQSLVWRFVICRIVGIKRAFVTIKRKFHFEKIYEKSRVRSK